MGICKTILKITTILLVAVSIGTAAAGTVAADGTPDLIITDIAPLPANPSIGDTVKFTVTVKNQGNGDAGQSRLVMDIDDDTIAAETLGPIGAGVTVARTFTWTATIGTHSIKATADANSQVSESSEANNVKTFTLSTQAPDFIVQSIEWEPEDPSRGDSITFEVKVKNQGSGRSPIGRINLFVDGNSRGYKDIPVLDGGESVTIDYSWVAQAGQHEIRAFADEERKISETNENNNELTATFSTLAPDLLVDWVKWEPKNPSVNENVEFTINIRNRGEGRSDASQVIYQKEEDLIGTDYIPAIEPGFSVNMTLDYIALADFPGILVTVDSNESVVESSEENNKYMINLMALQPDLVVSDIDWLPLDAAVGDSVTVKVRVENQGSGDSGASLLVCHIGADFQGYANVPALPADNEAALEFTWTARAGTQRIKATIDPANDLIESIETNNTREADFFITPPDLTIWDFNWEPEQPTIGDTVDFTLTIANNGGGEAQSFHTNYYIDGELINSNFSSLLASGAAANITFSWTAELGEHEFVCITDANDIIMEHDENNNEYSVGITPIVPDLAIEKIDWSPAEITAGDIVNITVTIKNRGTDRAVPFRNTYYIDDSVAGYQDIPELQAGEVVTQNILWTAASGLHAIRITLDSNNQVIEKDENNNTRIVNFPPPDLAIGEVNISPTEAAVGVPVNITVTVQNRGSGVAMDANIGYFVNGEPGEIMEVPDMAPGDVLTRTLTWVAGAGPCNITVAADAAKVVMESNETNNEKVMLFGTLTADLIIEDIICTQQNLSDSDDVTFGVVIRNQGSYASERARVALYIDELRAGEHEISAIPAGGTFTENFQIIVTSGEHDLKALADSTSLVSETDETNNEYERVFSTLTPDLTVNGLKWSPSEPIPGDTVIFTVPVKNQGRSVAENVNVTLYLDKELIGSHDILEIARSETISKTFSWQAIPGTHEISVMIDMDGIVTESNESNNNEVRTMALPDSPQVSALPDTSDSAGLLDKLWWLLYVTAFLFGGIAFYAVLRTSRKGPR